ncbi:MAG: hypothetical protein A2284_00710 [Deltaproteobacteria bacterium RIFOXYA12_FULL_61_11]|nr:MAG: hypothetical protein A2284_00710 [Deltaproteobacteria bacterium RIFOXYA12_FULL_61_11]
MTTSPLKLYQKTMDGERSALKEPDTIVQYLPLVKHVAMRIFQRTPPNVELDDLISYGILGLIDAHKKFNQQKNVEFKTYAEFRIRGAILDELRAKDWVPRSVRDKAKRLEEVCIQLELELERQPEDHEIAAAMQLPMADYHKYLNDIKSISFLSLDEIYDHPDGSGDKRVELQLTDDTIPSPFSAALRAELKDHLIDALDKMSEKERLVISLYYYEELTFKEIGQVMGITESYASQIHTQAIVRLKTKLRRRRNKGLVI